MVENLGFGISQSQAQNLIPQSLIILGESFLWISVLSP